MLSPIGEAPEGDSIEISDNSAKKLTFSTDSKRSLTEFVGGHGPWQFRQWLIYFFSSAGSSLFLFSIFPLTAPMDCGCKNISDFGSHTHYFACQNGSCSLEDFPLVNNSCHKYYIQSFTAVNQQNHGCFLTNLVIYAKCIYSIGILTAGPIILYCTKKFSRRVMAMLNGLFLLACSIATGWAETVANYLILRFISSFAITSIYLISVLTLLENLGEEYRLLYALTGHFGWSMTSFALPVITWITKDWTQYSAVLSFYSALILVMACFIPESIEGCMEKGLRARAQKLIRIAAWKNGITTVDVEQYAHVYSGQKNKEDELTSASMSKLHRTIQLLMMFLVGFSSSFLYFAMVWLSDWRREDRGSYLALCGTTQVAAVIILLFFTCIVSPKRLWAASTSLASLSLLLMYSQSSSTIAKLSTGPYLLAMFFASTSWTLYLIKSLFRPFTLPSTKWSILASTLAICCGIVFASLNDLQKYHNWNPKFFVVFGIPNLAVGTTAAFIPDRYFTF